MELLLRRACGRLVKRVEKSQVLTWFRESCFSSSAGITPNELLMIHIQLTPVHSRIVSQLAVQWLRTSLRHSEINLESLVVVYELEPAINLALHGVLWSLRIQFICGKFFSFCCSSMSNTLSNVVAWVCIISSPIWSWFTYVELRFVPEFMPSCSNRVCM